jgi:hypothetical protein
MMLDLGGNQVIAGLRQSEHREVVSFSSTAGEDNFGRAASQQVRNRFARSFYRRTRVLPMMVNR